LSQDEFIKTINATSALEQPTLAEGCRRDKIKVSDDQYQVLERIVKRVYASIFTPFNMER